MLSGMKNKIFRAVLCAAVWLLLWEILAACVKHSVILPSPRAVAVCLFGLMKSGEFYVVCFGSILRIFIGFIIGVIIGTALAALSQAGIEFLISPAMSVIKATPVASIIIVMLFFIGRERVPITATLLMVIPIIYTNVLRGIRAVPKELSEVAEVYSFSRAKRIRYCTVPSVLPYFSAGIKTSIGLAWKAGIAAEVICTPSGSIGSMLYDAKVYLESEELFTWTFTIVIISMIIEKLIVSALNRLTEGSAT